MLIQSKFVTGYGSLHVGGAGFTDEWIPGLTGACVFDFADVLDFGSSFCHRRIPLQIIARVIDGASLYQLTVGPWEGQFYKNPAKLDADDFDFFGLIGPCKEICVRGWKRTDDGGGRYISLEFEPANVEEPATSESLDFGFVLEI